MGPLTLDWGLTFWTLVTFGCLFLLLARFTFKPLKKILEEREERIRSALEKAEKAKQDAEAILDENARRLDEAREETRKIINEGHKIVAEMKREGQDRAKTEADSIVAQARVEIDRELQRSLDELKSTVTNLSLRVARQVIRAKLDEKEHAKLAEDFIERLKKSHASRQP